MSLTRGIYILFHINGSDDSDLNMKKELLKTLAKAMGHKEGLRRIVTFHQGVINALALLLHDKRLGSKYVDKIFKLLSVVSLPSDVSTDGYKYSFHVFTNY